MSHKAGLENGFWHPEAVGLLVLMFFSLLQCECAKPVVVPSLAFTHVPATSHGGPNRLDVLAGTVSGAKPGQRIVLYALSGTWWIQPFADKPFTDVQPDASWRASIHLGTQYAALLVEPTYVPEANLRSLPSQGGPIVAWAVIDGKGVLAPSSAQAKTLHFSGYDWEVRTEASPRGGKTNPYEPDNAWVDQRGHLHLRVTRQEEEWACAEVRLKTSLGQGLYRFTVADVSQIDPAAVMTLYTWADGAKDQRHHEIDIEVSRWGDLSKKNAQFLIQPYYEPANVSRFEAPAGRLTYSFRWEPGKASFRAARGYDNTAQSGIVSEHVFTTGVPSPEDAAVQMDLYAFGKTRRPMRNGSEVVIEKFDFLP